MLMAKGKSGIAMADGALAAADMCFAAAARITPANTQALG